MKIPLFIEKNNEVDCNYKCPFRSMVTEEDDNDHCLLFDRKLKKDGYYEVDGGHSYTACYPCRTVYLNNTELK